jgi:outer membrane lipoprotein-sorting protein
MRASRFLLLGLALIVCNSAVAQIQPTTPAPKDPQAVSILTQALAAAGGATAITGISDYTATGTITYHWNPQEQEQGSVTVRGRALAQIRVDANLSRGVRSWVISSGQTTIKSENGALWQYPPAHPIPSSDAFPYQPPLIPASLTLPHWALTTTLNRSRFTLSYTGVVQLDGHSVQKIQAQEGPTDSMLEYRTIDLFIDSTTFQIVMIQDSIPKHMVHQICYSNYTNVRGLLVPLSISEKIEGQSTWDMQLSQINFNTGLQDSTFTVQ